MSASSSWGDGKSFLKKKRHQQIKKLGQNRQKIVASLIVHFTFLFLTAILEIHMHFEGLLSTVLFLRRFLLAVCPRSHAMFTKASSLIWEARHGSNRKWHSSQHNFMLEDIFRLDHSGIAQMKAMYPIMSDFFYINIKTLYLEGQDSVLVGMHPLNGVCRPFRHIPTVGPLWTVLMHKLAMFLSSSFLLHNIRELNILCPWK